MAPFHRDGSTVLRLENHYEEIYFLTLSLVLSSLNSKGLKANSTLEPPSSFKHRTPRLRIQCLNHYVKNFLVFSSCFFYSLLQQFFFF